MIRYILFFLSYFLAEGSNRCGCIVKRDPVKKTNTLPFLYKMQIPTPTPRKHKNVCRFIQSFDRCMQRPECAWCKINLLKEGCYLTSVTDLLPTAQRCIEGGNPIPIEEVPSTLCGDVSFDDCALLPTIDIFYERV